MTSAEVSALDDLRAGPCTSRCHWPAASRICRPSAAVPPVDGERLHGMGAGRRRMTPEEQEDERREAEARRQINQLDERERRDVHRSCQWLPEFRGVADPRGSRGSVDLPVRLRGRVRGQSGRAGLQPDDHRQRDRSAGAVPGAGGQAGLGVEPVRRRCGHGGSIERGVGAVTAPGLRRHVQAVLHLPAGSPRGRE